MKKYLVLLAGLVFIFIGIKAIVATRPGNIKGKVDDVKGGPVAGAVIEIHETSYKTKSLDDGSYSLEILAPGVYDIRCSAEGYKSTEIKKIALAEGETKNINFRLIKNDSKESSTAEVISRVAKKEAEESMGLKTIMKMKLDRASRSNSCPSEIIMPQGEFFFAGEGFVPHNTEEYGKITENEFVSVTENPLSTFSIDVDAASYANVRRFINNNMLPYKDAVRVEEMINYFDYDYPEPEGNYPFSIFTEVSSCPWNKKNKLVHIGLQGKHLSKERKAASNLVFLLDVSGSMNNPNKLPLLKNSFRLLVNELDQNDRVAIVVYAGAAGLVLPSTSGENKNKILDAIDELNAGGSTAGGAGIQLAYKVAFDNFIKGGNNRVMLATDGDFNVGVSSTSEMVRMIEEKRNGGVFITVLGFGMGNYKDNRVEQIADKGNGNYYYIDNILEAKKVLVTELIGTLYTIAKDVKIQVEFNPAKVKGYRLVGYENRKLNKEDFNDDKKDAGELGAGHTVTALYEIILPEMDTKLPGVDELKYQETRIKNNAYKTDEMMTVKLRYKEPDGEDSKLVQTTVIDKNVNIEQASNNFRFSSAVAEFGMILMDSQFKGDATYQNTLDLAKASRGDDKFGYRDEFIKLVEKCELLDNKK